MCIQCCSNLKGYFLVFCPAWVKKIEREKENQTLKEAFILTGTPQSCFTHRGRNLTYHEQQGGVVLIPRM